MKKIVALISLSFALATNQTLAMLPDDLFGQDSDIHLIESLLYLGEENETNFQNEYQRTNFTQEAIEFEAKHSEQSSVALNSSPKIEESTQSQMPNLNSVRTSDNFTYQAPMENRTTPTKFRNNIIPTHQAPLFHPQLNGVPGLMNPGNICYANSTVQSLYYLPPFRKAILNAQINCNKSPLKKWNELFKNISQQTEITLNAIELIIAQKFENWVAQNDAMSFIRHCLNKLKAKSPNQRVDNVFKGEIAKELTCMNPSCQKKTTIFEPFYDISLEIINQKNQPLSLLWDALSNHFTPEIINDYKCETCKKLGLKIKREISQAPECVIIQLKRFQANQSRSSKTDHLVIIPETVDLADSQYKLCAILCHSGTLNAGHYYTYAKKENDWFKLNDHQTSQITSTKLYEILSQEEETGKPYILFYEKA